MGAFDKFLEALSRVKLAEFNLIKISPDIKKVTIGGTEFSVVGGALVVAPGVRVQPMLQADGTYEFVLPDGTKVTRPSLKNTDNVRYLSAE